MSPTEDLWSRAIKALQVARFTLELDCDTAASRAYYAAFYAVSAYFLIEGRHFTKHKAVEAAVHRDLVKTGLWSDELGEQYSRLYDWRTTGDYGEADHVSQVKATMAVDHARAILRAVSKMKPHSFPWQEELFA